MTSDDSLPNFPSLMGGTLQEHLGGARRRIAAGMRALPRLFQIGATQTIGRRDTE